MSSKLSSSTGLGSFGQVTVAESSLPAPLAKLAATEIAVPTRPCQDCTNNGHCTEHRRRYGDYRFHPGPGRGTSHPISRRHSAGGKLPARRPADWLLIQPLDAARSPQPTHSCRYTSYSPGRPRGRGHRPDAAVLEHPVPDRGAYHSTESTPGFDAARPRH